VDQVDVGHSWPRRPAARKSRPDSIALGLEAGRDERSRRFTAATAASFLESARSGRRPSPALDLGQHRGQLVAVLEGISAARTAQGERRPAVRLRDRADNRVEEARRGISCCVGSSTSRLVGGARTNRARGCFLAAHSRRRARRDDFPPPPGGGAIRLRNPRRDPVQCGEPEGGFSGCGSDPGRPASIGTSIRGAGWFFKAIKGNSRKWLEQVRQPLSPMQTGRPFFWSMISKGRHRLHRAAVGCQGTPVGQLSISRGGELRIVDFVAGHSVWPWMEGGSKKS